MSDTFYPAIIMAQLTFLKMFVFLPSMNSHDLTYTQETEKDFLE